jgi:hypothetical protein
MRCIIFVCKKWPPRWLASLLRPWTKRRSCIATGLEPWRFGRFVSEVNGAFDPEVAVPASRACDSTGFQDRLKVPELCGHGIARGF